MINLFWIFFSRKKYEEMSLDLIRNGTDQCRCALKRFGKKKEFRKANPKISKQQWRKNLEHIDIKFDHLDKQVEEVLQRARTLVTNSSSINGFDAIDDEQDSIDYADEGDLGSNHFHDFDGMEPIGDFGEDTVRPDKVEKHRYASNVKRKSNTKRKRTLIQNHSNEFRAKKVRQQNKTRQNLNEGSRLKTIRSSRSLNFNFEGKTQNWYSSNRLGLNIGGDLKFQSGI